jgi:hypothetical protein
MSNEPTIMETIASVSKALQEYECAGGFSPAAGAEVADAALAAPVAHVEPTAGVSAPSLVDEGQEVPPPQSAEAIDAPASVAEIDASEAVVGEEASSSPRPIVANTEGIEARVPDEPAVVVQGPVAPETMTRAASPEIQEAKEVGASLSQGAMGGEARTLELACASWEAFSSLGVESEDDEEVVARNNLEHGMTWARRAFDELILPATVTSLNLRVCKDKRFQKLAVNLCAHEIE